MAGEELPELLQARFLPHGHGRSPGGVLVRNSSHEGNDGPEGEGLLLLQGAPHTGLLWQGADAALSWGRRFHLSIPTWLPQPLSDTADFTLLLLSTTEQH